MDFDLLYPLKPVLSTLSLTHLDFYIDIASHSHLFGADNGAKHNVNDEKAHLG
jgi:hypothetical protein